MLSLKFSPLDWVNTCHTWYKPPSFPYTRNTLEASACPSKMLAKYGYGMSIIMSTFGAWRRLK